MKLRTKTLAVLGASFITLILLLYGLSSTILMDGFVLVERKEVVKDLTRTDYAFSHELSQIGSTTRDYSGWDDG